MNSKTILVTGGAGFGRLVLGRVGLRWVGLGYGWCSFGRVVLGWVGLRVV